MNEDVAAILKKQPTEHWVEVLNAAGVPCGPVNSIDQTLNDPQVKHPGVVRQVDHPRLGTLDVVRQPVNLTATPQPQTFRYPTPDAGEHSDVILQEMGFGAAEIAALRDAKAI